MNIVTNQEQAPNLLWCSISIVQTKQMLHGSIWYTVSKKVLSNVWSFIHASPFAMPIHHLPQLISDVSHHSFQHVRNITVVFKSLP